VHPDVVRLRGQLDAAQKRLGELEVEIKTSRDDAATASTLEEEKELLRSRMVRLKQQLAQHGEVEAQAAPAGH